MQSSNVDFPAPDGPKRIVMPGGISNWTSRKKKVAELPRRVLRTRAANVVGLTWMATGPMLGGRHDDSVRIPRPRHRRKSRAAVTLCGSHQHSPGIVRDR